MYVQLFRYASCVLPQQQEVLVWKQHWQERSRTIISACPDTQENLLESKETKKEPSSTFPPNLPPSPPPKKKEYNEVFILGVL